MRALGQLISALLLMSLGAAIGFVALLYVIARPIAIPDPDWRPLYDAWMEEGRTDEARRLLWLARLAEVPSAMAFWAESFLAGDDLGIDPCEDARQVSTDSAVDECLEYERARARATIDGSYEPNRMYPDYPADFLPRLGGAIRNIIIFRGSATAWRANRIELLCGDSVSMHLNGPPRWRLASYLHAHTGSPDFQSAAFESRLAYCREQLYRLAASMADHSGDEAMAASAAGAIAWPMVIKRSYLRIAADQGSDAARFHRAKAEIEDASERGVDSPCASGDQASGEHLFNVHLLALRRMIELAREDFEPAKWFLIRYYQGGEGTGAPIPAAAVYWLDRSFAADQAARARAALSAEDLEALALLEAKGPHAALSLDPALDPARACLGTAYYVFDFPPLR
ncbi:MAG: hypothetical protein HXY25_10640 [Alphaproteobacteria bacterium]|nr:hypothetical protein [Alphaproteobacteria bacterium]